MLLTSPLAALMLQLSTSQINRLIRKRHIPAYAGGAGRNHGYLLPLSSLALLAQRKRSGWRAREVAQQHKLALAQLKDDGCPLGED